MYALMCRDDSVRLGVHIACVSRPEPLVRCETSRGGRRDGLNSEREVSD
jgi:hypothetical protein